MTVREFLESDIDLSWNKCILLQYEKFPDRYLEVEIPEYLNGFPYNIVEICEEKFDAYLDYELTTLLPTWTGRGIVLSLF